MSGKCLTPLVSM